MVASVPVVVVEVGGEAGEQREGGDLLETNPPPPLLRENRPAVVWKTVWVAVNPRGSGEETAARTC